jgi:hypothetical protein
MKHFNKKVVILVSVITAGAAFGGYKYWQYEDARKRAAALLEAQNSLFINFEEDPVIEYGAAIDDPEELALSYVTDSFGDIQVENAENIDSSTVGPVTLTYTVSTKDSYGTDVSASQDLTITVQDTQAPEILFTSDTVEIQEGDSFDPLDNVKEVTDPVDGSLEKSALTVDNPVNTSEPGSYTVTLTAADINGNTKVGTYAVTVNPKVQPKVSTSSYSQSASVSSGSYNSGENYYSESSGSSGGWQSDNSTSTGSDISDWEIEGPSDEDIQNAIDEGNRTHEEGTSWGVSILPDGSVIWDD